MMKLYRLTFADGSTALVNADSAQAANMVRVNSEPPVTVELEERTEPTIIMGEWQQPSDGGKAE